MATRWQRLQWNPILPLTLLVLHGALIAAFGGSQLRIGGVVVMTIWSVLALYDWRSGGKWVERLYDKS